MMKIGLMSYEIDRPSIEDLFQAIREYHCEQVQFSFHTFCKTDCSPDSTMSKMVPAIEDAMIEDLAYQSRVQQVEISMMTGFWNMISRDVDDREEGLLRLERLMQACNATGCNVINLCTGSKGRHMWDRVPENNTMIAWLEICETMEKALKLAEHYKVYLGIEVEASNVVNTAEKARKLMDTMRSPWLKVVLDGANVFWPGQCAYANATRILKEAMDLLAGDIVGVHGKDMLPGDELDFTYCGNGIVNFDYMLQRLKSVGYTRGILLHGAHDEAEIPPSVANIKALLKKHGM